eukprot:3249473-Pleurochrysis_carterae.AAC.1
MSSLHRSQRVPNASDKTLKRLSVAFTRKGAGEKLGAGGRKAVGLFEWFKYSLNQRRNDPGLADGLGKVLGKPAEESREKPPGAGSCT